MYTHKDITYRPATEKDVVGLSLFLTAITEENALASILQHDLPTIVNTIKSMLKDNQGAVLLAIDKNDIIVGAIVLGYTTLWWSTQGFFTNLAYYVTPEYRKGYGIQGKLLELTKDFADGTGIPVLLDIFDNTDRHEKVVRYLSFKGYKNIGFKALYTPRE